MKLQGIYWRYLYTNGIVVQKHSLHAIYYKKDISQTCVQSCSFWKYFGKKSVFRIHELPP